MRVSRKAAAVTAFLAAFIAWASFAAAAEAPIRPRPESWARPMVGARVGNLFMVSPEVYRSEQPDDEAMRELEAFGIRSVLSLRRFHDDADEAKGTAIAVHRVAMDAGEIRDAQILEALRVLAKAEKPVLVHCWHGSDRTGVVVAMYRMVFQGWRRDDALDELRWGGFGYHEQVYPNIREYLSNVDLEAMKRALQ